MKKFYFLSIFLLFSFFTAFFPQRAWADAIDLTTKLHDVFSKYINDNEGSTTFRSLAIPLGGRSESLGTAFSAVCDDISFIDYNPAASSTIKNTEVALFHNSWISDSNMDTVAFTTRFENLGIGAQVKCFYVPFSEYNSFGDKVATSYYSETTATANISYNFFPGYKFRGLAVGANLKTSFRSMPDYTDNNTNEIISGSGLEQSAIAFLADFGVLARFNFLKFYTDRETNFSVSLFATNFGYSVTFGGELDDAPPSKIGAGISYRPFSPFLISAEIRKNLNLKDFSKSEGMEIAFGAGIKITNFFEILNGFLVKGGNARLSFGGQFNLNRFTINANYTLDLTSSFNPLNHISISVKLHFGDKGRGERQLKIDNLYSKGMELYAQGHFDEAIEVWKEVLEMDKYFDPAIDAINAVEKFQIFYKNIKEIQNLD